jgi:endogenous inhibitor of DNA gyrase (YacG/DUF329 family)
MSYTTTCAICGRPGFFSSRGWEHEDLGYYLQRCERCGAFPIASLEVTCPTCGSNQLRDDHCFRPFGNPPTPNAQV